MGTRPEEMRSEIAGTRAELAADVDRLADRTSPARIVQRRTDRVRRAARSGWERIMGTSSQATGQVREVTSGTASTVAHGAQQAAGTVREGAQQAAGAVRQGAGQAAEAVRAAPEQAMRRTQGNPLAAGLIAFGAGLLAASLIPRTEAEQRATDQLRQQAGELIEPVKEAVRESAGTIGQEAKDVTRGAARQVGQTASQAAGTTTDHARERARQVGEQGRPTP